VFVWEVDGKHREIGLGSLLDAPNAKAREKAAETPRSLQTGWIAAGCTGAADEAASGALPPG
jgi:hypothetical protein